MIEKVFTFGGAKRSGSGPQFELHTHCRLLVVNINTVETRANSMTRPNALGEVLNHEGRQTCDSELASYWTCTYFVSCSYLEER